MELPKPRLSTYSQPGPVSTAFMESESFVRGIMGPIGSGKSTSCVMEILRRAQFQRKSPDGKRRTRWCVIRNSYPELKSTTIKTWMDWVPAHYGKTNFDSPIVHHVTTTELDMEVLFLALDKPDDMKKLLSLELTGAWVNEAREIPKSIIDALTGRVGRYPSVNQGGCSWSGIMMDTNPPDTESWWYKFEQDVPEGWEFFRQPSGTSEQAENVANLPKDYYKRIMAGKDQEWINVYVHGEYGFLIEGQAVYPMFRDGTHVSAEILEPAPGYSLMIGADFGLTPCAIIGQRLPGGQWAIIDEFITEDYGIKRFAEELSAYVGANYPNFDVSVAVGDPSGDFRSPNSDDTCIDILNLYTPWKWQPAPTNDLSMRLEVVKGALQRMVDGKPAFIVSPKCKTIRKGFNGSYHYKLIKGGDGTRTHNVPDKNSYSHPHDALQYLLLGGGETGVVLNKKGIQNDPYKRFGNSPKMIEQIDRARSGGGYSGFKTKSWKPKGW
jgi:hypothetical protein